MNNYKDQVVVITGGATGIGYSFAKKFGEEGAKLVIASRRQSVVENSVSTLKGLGYEVVGMTCDVSDLAQVEALADFAWAVYGQVDVIMNNAGISQEMISILEADVELYRKVFDINVFGVIHGIKVFGKRFVEQGTPAAIYNLGSENSYFNGVPSASAYVASKHAVRAITESLKEEMPEFIDVSLITPGYVAAEMTEGIGGAMPADEFTSIIMPQLKEGNFYCVSHSYNMKRIEDRFQEVKSAYDTYAPRYKGDDEYDVRTMLQKLALE